jgi:hypothetical protein
MKKQNDFAVNVQKNTVLRDCNEAVLVRIIFRNVHNHSMTFLETFLFLHNLVSFASTPPALHYIRLLSFIETQNPKDLPKLPHNSIDPFVIMNTYLHSHKLAKKLNNTAAHCIETGQYERGISCLVEALQLSNNSQQLFFKPNGRVASTVCQCEHCSLDECIIFSEYTSLNSITTTVIEDDDVAAYLPNYGYIHRRPIRITPQSSQDGHNMGATLSLIITFNLALAHHLSALSTFAVDSDDNHKQSSLEDREYLYCKQTCQRILYLYELAYRWQIELDEHRVQKLRQVTQQQQQQQLQELNRFSWNYETTLDLDASPVTSLRFNMIICNNLSQIHRLVQNHSKHRRCLEHLLATIMFVVVTDGPQQQQTRFSSSSSSSSSSLSSSSFSSNTNWTTSSLASSTNTQRLQQHNMDLEGFLLNATQVVLQLPCAGAA